MREGGGGILGHGLSKCDQTLWKLSLQWEFNVSLSLRVVKVVVVVKPCGCCLFCVWVCVFCARPLSERTSAKWGKVLVMRKLFKVGQLSFLL